MSGGELSVGGEVYEGVVFGLREEGIVVAGGRGVGGVEVGIACWEVDASAYGEALECSMKLIMIVFV